MSPQPGGIDRSRTERIALFFFFLSLFYISIMRDRETETLVRSTLCHDPLTPSGSRILCAQYSSQRRSEPLAFHAAPSSWSDTSSPVPSWWQGQWTVLTLQSKLWLFRPLKQKERKWRGRPLGRQVCMHFQSSLRGLFAVNVLFVQIMTT